jgi:hypothetical protein
VKIRSCRRLWLWWESVKEWQAPSYGWNEIQLSEPFLRLLSANTDAIFHIPIILNGFIGGKLIGLSTGMPSFFASILETTVVVMPISKLNGSNG